MSNALSEPGSLTSPPSARAVLVVGSARSGANDLARALELLGLRTPGDAWVSELHERLLRRVNVAVADARPQAWLETGKLAADESVRRELFDRLEAEASGEPSEMTIADPRLGWFLGLWRAASLRVGVDDSYAVMLRAPYDVIGTSRPGVAHTSEASRAAGWVNQALHVERATRGARRAFVSHEDLLEDWTVPLYTLGERFGLGSVHNATAREIRRVHDLIEAAPVHGRRSGADLEIPPALRVLVDETWDQLTQLARAEDERPEVTSALDELRRSYTQFYEDAERVTQSTLVAARRRKPSRSAAGPESSPEADATPSRRRLLRRRPTT